MWSFSLCDSCSIFQLSVFVWSSGTGWLINRMELLSFRMTTCEDELSLCGGEWGPGCCVLTALTRVVMVPTEYLAMVPASLANHVSCGLRANAMWCPSCNRCCRLCDWLCSLGSMQNRNGVTGYTSIKLLLRELSICAGYRGPMVTARGHQRNMVPCKESCHNATT